MPLVTPQQEFDMLVELIGAKPAGMGIEAIAQKLSGSYQRRTLQRLSPAGGATTHSNAWGKAGYPLPPPSAI